MDDKSDMRDENIDRAMARLGDLWNVLMVAMKHVIDGEIPVSSLENPLFDFLKQLKLFPAPMLEKLSDHANIAAEYLGAHPDVKEVIKNFFLSKKDPLIAEIGEAVAMIKSGSAVDFGNKEHRVEKMEYGWKLMRSALVINSVQMFDEGLKEFTKGYGYPYAETNTLKNDLDNFVKNSSAPNLVITNVDDKLKAKLDATVMGQAILENLTRSYGPRLSRPSINVIPDTTPESSPKVARQRSPSSPGKPLLHRVLSVVRSRSNSKVDAPRSPSMSRAPSPEDQRRSQRGLETHASEVMNMANNIHNKGLKEMWISQLIDLVDGARKIEDLPSKEKMDAVVRRVNDAIAKGQSLSQFENVGQLLKAEDKKRESRASTDIPSIPAPRTPSLSPKKSGE